MNKNTLNLISVLLFALFTGFLFLQFSESPVSKRNIAKTEQKFQEGDIIFQTSNSLQSKAIQLATNSKYSHVGILVNHKGSLVVLEAVQPVKYTPIQTWINQGVNNQFKLKRLKNKSTILADSTLTKMRKKGNSWINKSYDIAFDWSDKKLYCSELVWKLYYHATGLKVGKLKKLKDYDLSHPIVKEAMKKRYGSAIPWEEKMISPQAIFESKLLESVN